MNPCKSHCRKKLGYLFSMVGILTGGCLSSTAPTELPHHGGLELPEDSFLKKFSKLNVVDQHDRPFNPELLLGKVVLFNFIFTGCSKTCPPQTQQLKAVLEALPSEVRKQTEFVSVSLDPHNDTPSRLRAFIQTMDVDLPDWTFVTGNPKHLQQIAERLHMYDDQATRPDPQVHRTTLWLVDAQGQLLQRYRGMPVDQKRLIHEIGVVSQMTNKDMNH